MAYATGVASGSVETLQALVTFLTDNGWTLDNSSTDPIGGGGAGWRAHLHLGSVYANFHAAEGTTGERIWENQYANSAYGIGMYLGDGYSGAQDWRSQSGRPIGIGWTYTVGAAMAYSSGNITAYHFFCDSGGDHVLIVVEKPAGIYSYLGFGTTLEKAGGWTGGPYFFGSAFSGYHIDYLPTPAEMGHGANPMAPFHSKAGFFDSFSSAFVRADVDTFIGQWLSCGNPQSGGNPATGYTGKRCMGAKLYRTVEGQPVNEIPHYGTFQDRQTSALNGLANLLSSRVFVQRDTSGWSYLGIVPNVYVSNATDNGFTAASEYVLGSDTYLVFPNFAVKKIV